MLCDGHWKQHQQQRIRNCTPAWKPLQRSFFPEVNQNKACFIWFFSTASVAIPLAVHFSVGIDHLLNKPNSLPSVTAERLWIQASAKLLLLLHVNLLREERTGDGVWPHTSRQHWPWQKKDRCPQSSVWSRGKIKERFWIPTMFSGYEAMYFMQQASNNVSVYPSGWRGRLQPHNSTGKQELLSIAWDCQDLWYLWHFSDLWAISCECLFHVSMYTERKTCRCAVTCGLSRRWSLLQVGNWHKISPSCSFFRRRSTAPAV